MLQRLKHARAQRGKGERLDRPAAEKPEWS
jgi:hypothetical protein